MLSRLALSSPPLSIGSESMRKRGRLVDYSVYVEILFNFSGFVCLLVLKEKTLV